jgi:hypothetical protein
MAKRLYSAKEASKTNPDWDFVREEIDRIIPIQIKLSLKKELDLNTKGIEKEVVS